jgi:hypothetical protein
VRSLRMIFAGVWRLGFMCFPSPILVGREALTRASSVFGVHVTGSGGGPSKDGFLQFPISSIVLSKYIC